MATFVEHRAITPDGKILQTATMPDYERWMPGLPCPGLAEQAEAKLAAIREVLTTSLTETGDDLGVLGRPADDSAMLDRALRLIDRLLAVIGSEEYAYETRVLPDGEWEPAAVIRQLGRQPVVIVRGTPPVPPVEPFARFLR